MAGAGAFQTPIIEESVNTQIMQHFCHCTLTISSIFVVAECQLSQNIPNTSPLAFRQILTLL